MKWAARGFADPAAYILFLAGVLLATSRRMRAKFCRRLLFGALLLALGIFMKPIVAPGGGGCSAAPARHALSPAMAAACWSLHRVSCRCSRWRCTTGFTATSSCCSAPMPSTRRAGDAALGLCRGRARIAATLDFGGGYFVRRLLCSIVRRLAERRARGISMRPFHSRERRGVAILIYVVLRGRRFDPWLRLVGAQRWPSMWWRCSIMPRSPAIIS